MNRALLLSTLLLLAPLRALAGDEPVVKGELGAKLDHTVQLASKGGFWGTVLVAKGGEVVLSKGYGNADYHLRPNGPRTLYEIASVSKMFTAAAILKLEAQGKLATSDGLGKFFEGVPEDKKGITLLQLLSHTSGTSPDIGLAYDAKETREEFVAYMFEQALSGKPGEKFEYSNAAYALLAAIVEKASGKKFEEYVRENIFAPAGMKDSGFLNDEKLDRARAAVRLHESELDRTAAEWSWSWGYRGMGGVVTTAEDLLRFDRSLRANEVLSADAQKKQTTAVIDVAGLGCFLERTFRATTKVYHTGGVAGFTSMFARYVEDDVVIVVLSNEAGDPSGLEAALIGTIFPPPTTSVAIDLSPKAPETGVLVIKQGSTWKGERAEKDVLLKVKWVEATPATAKLSPESAKALLTMLKDALDARSKEKVAEDATPEMETCLYTTQYEVEENKLELPKLSIKVMPKYITERNGEPVEDQRITLVLVDTAQSFWPVIIKMNSAAAKQLVAEIERGLKD